MPDITAQVVNVTTRQTRNGRVVYDVATSDGAVRSLWDGATARELTQYVLQQPVQLRIRQRPRNDGQGVWEDITAYAPMGQPLPPEQGQQGFAGQPYQQQAFAGVPQTQQAPFVASQPKPYQGGMSDADKTRVTKLSSINYAAILVASLFHGAGPEAVVDASNMTLRVAEIFYKRARSHENAPSAPSDGLGGFRDQAALTPPLTGAQIASGIPGVSLGAPVEANMPEDEGDDVAGADSGWD